MSSHRQLDRACFNRVLQYVERRKNTSKNGRFGQVLLGLASGAFVVAAIVGWRSLPEVETNPHYWLLAIVFVLAAPTTAFVNGLEYAFSARLVGQQIKTIEAAKIAVLASAANLLPLPGAVAVRAQALRQRGVATKHALWATAVTGASWVGVALVLAGLLHANFESIQSGVAITAAGLMLVVFAAVMIRITTGEMQLKNLGLIVTVEILSVLLGTLRYLVVIRGLGHQISVHQALSLVVAGILATLLGITPGGLGIREAIAAAVSPLVGLAASIGVVGAALDRIIALPGLAVLALMVASKTKPSPRSEIPLATSHSADVPRTPPLKGD